MFFFRPRPQIRCRTRRCLELPTAHPEAVGDGRHRNARNRNMRRDRSLPITAIALLAAPDSNPCAAISRFLVDARTQPEKMFSPCKSGASSLLDTSTCKPRQIPRKGTPRGDGIEKGVAQPVFIQCTDQRGVVTDAWQVSTPTAFANASAESTLSVGTPRRCKARSTEGRFPGARNRRAIFSQQTLGAGQHAAKPLVARYRKTQRSRKRLEHRFHLMMRDRPYKTRK